MKSMNRILAIIAVALTVFLPQMASATSLSDYAENKLIDWLVRGQTFTPPTTWYVALYTDTCADASAGTEATGGGYARVAVTASLANWAGTQAAASTTASTGTGGTTSNNAAITFPTSTGPWSTGSNMQSVGFTDASTAGNRLICIDLTSPFAVTASGVTLSFPAAALTFQIDN